MKGYLFWDLDDTLIKTQPAYEEVIHNTTLLVQQLLNVSELSMESIQEIFQKIDLHNANTYGLSKERFIMSWVETYEKLAHSYNCSIYLESIEEVRRKANMIFTMKLENYPYVHEVLAELKKEGYEMNILTAGDEEIQYKRVDDAEIREYFDNIYVVPFKNQQVLCDIIGDRDIRKCIMIGNSLRSDISPALENDVFAIHIPRETWAYDQRDVDMKHPKYYSVKDLMEIPHVVKKIEEEMKIHCQ